MGYRFQFVTLAGFHAMNHALFRLAQGYAARGMGAYSDLQEQEFEAEQQGYQAVKHQTFVGTGYFDQVAQVLSGGMVSTLAMEGSTERAQFSGKSDSRGPSEAVPRKAPEKPRT
jgi:isocitrate lyase